MKKAINFSLLLLCIVLIATSCEENFDTPELIEPSYTCPYGNVDDYMISIETLKSMNTNDLDSITDSVIISGVIIANDESGNLYKVLEIQDETAGIEIMLNTTSLYNTYKVGQMVYVECRGLYLGKYGEITKLGTKITDDGEEEIGRISQVVYEDHLFLDGFPDTTNLPAPDTIKSTSDLDDSKLNTLVILPNASWEAAGSTYATYESSTSRTIYLEDGTTMVAYNSGYADFYADTLPSGTGTIVGVLSKYGSNDDDYQLLIRSLDDVYDFDGEENGNGGSSGTSGYTLATSVEEGTYVLAVYSSSYIALCPLGESYSYGYPSGGEATYSDGVLDTDEENEITIVASTNGYYIKDSYGKYISSSSDYKTFSVSSSVPSSAGEWTFTKNDDGTFKIMDTTYSRYIQYSTSYTSYGLYTDKKWTNALSI